jgi:anti-sigma factor RsiW
MRHQEEERPSELFDGITCQQVVALLMDYIAGALESETALTLQKHLRDCQECVAFLHTYQATIRATRALRDVDISPAMQYCVLSFLREKIQRSPPER